MSKLSTLKQEAYQAGKRKNWAQAIMFYEQILEYDKNNPTAINELGDLCLKGDENARAVSYFLSAAAKYRTTGLLNNSIAIYKKILRHESENLNAHWYLAETRAKQGLVVEAENHAVHFLDNSENVSGDIKEIFLKRCQSLFELFPHSRIILSRLSQIFHMWTMALEAARAECLLACMDFSGGKEDEARQAIDDLTAKVAELMNYPEFTKWNKLVDPTSVEDSPFSDFGAVALGDEIEEESPAAAEPAVAEPPADDNEANFGDLDIGGDAAPAAVAEAPAGEVPVDNQPAAEDSNPLFAQANPAAKELDDDGCFSIDNEGEGTNFDDLIAEASSGLPKLESSAEVLADTSAAAATDSADPLAGLDELADKDDSGEAKVDLLSQMLEKEGADPVAGASGELATITSEIGAAIGGDENADADRLYEMGMVYLEMGLFDQACDSFETAATDEQFCVRALEMWGITLQRANRHEESIKVLTNGLEFADAGSREYHGLMYHLGLAQEANGQPDEAIKCFRTINDVDPRFADVGRRLAKLTAV